ncbi:hypothetical protein DFR58_12936 [Anaerobacterium chartisolvens]|uniref:Uncharacterized protein n=1 Tax=Anaerobacterium chartisolvens TaxID=1297424 RepID=A0A369ASL2_9FIRM|nr:hypothetical protein [Anaerobacterium chartisolvens]RCX10444.1 hypothetical protein DFR58_12936 [Anaerobacterium chartisolvens]
MLTVEKNSKYASNPYDAALKWFKDKNGVDFFELSENNEKRKEFYKKGNSIKNPDEEEIQDVYKHTIEKHY